MNNKFLNKKIEINSKKEKFNFNKKKENAIKSLSEVESFLRNFSQINKYKKLITLLKK